MLSTAVLFIGSIFVAFAANRMQCTQAAMWQCFLRSSTNSIRYKHERGGTIELTGIDGAKLQCCHKATTFRCRDLCIKVGLLVIIYSSLSLKFVLSAVIIHMMGFVRMSVFTPVCFIYVVLSF